MRVYLLFYLSLIICSCKSQNKSFNVDSTAKKNLETQVNQMTQAFISSDYETLVKFTYPAIVKKAGGIENSVAQIQKDVEDLKAQGVTFDSVSVGEPSIFVRAGEEIHTVIPQTQFLNVPRGTIKAESYLLAITQDQGKTWYFLDTAEIDSNNVRKILPNYNFDLKIPPSKEPVLIKAK